MQYPLSEKYDRPGLMAKIMGPNPLKLEEELLTGHRIGAGATVCDLGSGQGLTSVFLAKEYGFKVYAADLWSDPEANRRFFSDMGLSGEQIVPVKADALDLPFAHAFFDAVVSTDSYNYFGRDAAFLDDHLLPFVKPGGLIYITVPGMKRDCQPRRAAAGAPALLDAGAAGLPARRGVLAGAGEPLPRGRGPGGLRDGVERGGLGRLAEAGQRVRRRGPEGDGGGRRPLPELHQDCPPKALNKRKGRGQKPASFSFFGKTVSRAPCSARRSDTRSPCFPAP